MYIVNSKKWLWNIFFKFIWPCNFKTTIKCRKFYYFSDIVIINAFEHLSSELFVSYNAETLYALNSDFLCPLWLATTFLLFVWVLVLLTTSSKCSHNSFFFDLDDWLILLNTVSSKFIHVCDTLQCPFFFRLSNFACL